MNSEVIAKNLIEIRKLNDFTQKELAAKINYSDKVISKWECGESLPDILALNTLATLYNVKVDDIINGVDTKRDYPADEVRLEKTVKPHLIVVTSFISLIFIWGIMSLFVPTYMLIPLTALYIIFIILLGLSINHHEWESTFLSHEIKIVNRFHKSELWIDGKLIDEKYSITAIGINLGGRIGSKSIKVNVFRLVTFNCKVIVE